MDRFFEWDDEKDATNQRKHGVAFDEAKTVFGDPLAITISDPDHSEDEQRWIDIGRASAGRTLVVWYVERGEVIRIIGSRRASRRERVSYEGGELEWGVCEMRAEYDFSGGVRGKHYTAYRSGHSVRILKKDGTVEEHCFSLAEGAVLIDPDLREHFPDSESVNRALRSLLS